MKKIFVIILVAFAIAAGAYFTWWVLQNTTKDAGINASTEEMRVRGAIIEIVSDEQVDMFDEIRMKKISIHVPTNVRITRYNDSDAEPQDIRRGFSIEATGVLTANSRMEAFSVNITKEPNIIVFSPSAGDEIGIPVLIQGEARVFENQFNYRIKDSDGTILKESGVMADSPDAGTYGSFRIETAYASPKGTSGVVEVFDYSAKDGTEDDIVLIPVKFKKVETATVKVHFGNTEFDPNVEDCTRTFAVDRIIPKTSSIGRAALEELLLGPTLEEKNAGYFTSINPGVKIQKLTIANNIARADFDDTLEFQIGGSCRVAAISAQIINTLKQFPTVKEVIISINGRTEDILQP